MGGIKQKWDDFTLKRAFSPKKVLIQVFPSILPAKRTLVMLRRKEEHIKKSHQFNLIAMFL